MTGGEDADRFAGRLGADCVAFSESGLILAFVPDPDGPGARRRSAAPGDSVAVIGPTVALDRSHLSLARAQAAHAARSRGVIATAGPIVRAEQHLVRLMLHGDPALTAEIAARALAPLDELKPGARATDRHLARMARQSWSNKPHRRDAPRPSADRPLPRRPAA